MSEKRKTLTEVMPGKEVSIEYPEAFTIEEFTPLIDRLEKEDPALLGDVLKLFDKMEPAEFATYINGLIKMKRHEDSLLIITKNNMHKSVIEGQFLDLIAKTLSVKYIRVFSNM